MRDGTVITPSTSVHNLDVMFDSEFSMSQHCFYQLRQLHSVHHSLSSDIAITLVHAFISSRLDYCNSLIFGATNLVMLKLPIVQNAATRQVTSLSRHECITPALMDLHWLLVRQNFDYKIAFLVYKCLHGSGPLYLTEYYALLSTANQHHQLRSATHGYLIQHRTKTQRFGPCSFWCSGPCV